MPACLVISACSNLTACHSFHGGLIDGQANFPFFRPPKFHFSKHFGHVSLGLAWPFTSKVILHCLVCLIFPKLEPSGLRISPPRAFAICKHPRPDFRPHLALGLHNPSAFMRMSSHVIQSHSLLSEACSGPPCSHCYFASDQSSSAAFDNNQKEKSLCSARFKSTSNFD